MLEFRVQSMKKTFWVHHIKLLKLQLPCILFNVSSSKLCAEESSNQFLDRRKIDIYRQCFGIS